MRLTLVDRVRCIDHEKGEVSDHKPVRMGVQVRKERKTAHRKKVWVVGNCQFPVVNSWVVTFVHVMHSDTSWPASRERTKRLVHRLRKRHHVLRKKASKEE